MGSSFNQSFCDFKRVFVKYKEIHGFKGFVRYSSDVDEGKNAVVVNCSLHIYNLNNNCNGFQRKRINDSWIVWPEDDA